MNYPILSIFVISLLPAAAEGERRRPGPPPVIRALDTDRDRRLSQEEIEAAADALGELDRNGDGQLDPREIHPPRREPAEAPREGERPPRHHPTPPVIEALDLDGDGILSETEIEAAPDSLSELDRNGDGQLTPREMHPRPPRPRHQGGDEGRGGPDAQKPQGPADR